MSEAVIIDDVDVLASAHLPYAERESVEIPEDIELADDVDEPHDTLEAESSEDEPQEGSSIGAALAAEVEVDDYGNEKPKQESKTYTEEEVNERINKAVRERLARLEKNAPGVPEGQQPAQALSSDDTSWEQQLESFVEQAVGKMTHKQAQQAQQQREQQVQLEFESKLHNGMSKFTDFVQVVGHQPITDAMTVATRSMSDPAAFLYAASKRHAPELQRISNLDPYTQMVEIGRLEERMKKAKVTSSAPRPLTQTREDSSMNTHREEKEPTIEDLIAQSDAKRMKTMNARRSR